MNTFLASSFANLILKTYTSLQAQRNSLGNNIPAKVSHKKCAPDGFLSHKKMGF